MTTMPARLTELTDLRAMHDEALSLGSVFSVARRRRGILLSIFTAFLVLTTIYCIIATRRYQATGQVQIQKESMGAFGLDASVMGDAADSASDALDYNITLQTEANILTSDSLALQVIKELHLEPTKDFFPSAKANSGIRPFWKKPVEPLTIPIDKAPDRRYTALKIFASHLKVEPITGTRLINISYSNPDPQLAADVVNHLIAALMDYSYQARFTATAQASNWLTSQLDDLRRQTETLQTKAMSLERNTGMFGDDASHNVVLARLEALNGTLAEAESNRILKESVYRVASSGDPELISGLSGNSAGAVASMANSLGLIQSLRAQEATVKTELDQDRIRYGPQYPRIAELQAELGGIEKSIHDEVHRIGERARTDYEIAQHAETSARSAFEQQKALANDMNDKAMAFVLAKQEADGSRQVYEGLLAKLKQAGVLEGLRSTNITVVNPARVPPPSRPKSPNLLLYYAAAVAAGLLFGTGAAFFREKTDNKVRALEEVEHLTSAPVLGLIPDMASRSRQPYIRRKAQSNRAAEGRQIATVSYIDSPFAESLRMLRTSLMISRSGGPPQVVLITSPGAGEGKSTISLNLAASLAQQGARVLLVDADMRRPVLHQRVGLSNEHGLSTALSSDASHPKPQRMEALPNLSVLCGGPVPPFPAEFLGSRRMREMLAQWRYEYDFIVLDCPPVLPVADSVVLAQQCDAILLVTRHGATRKKSVERAYRTIRTQTQESVVLGMVLNAVPDHSSDFYDYYGYRGRTYNAEEGFHEARV